MERAVTSESSEKAVIDGTKMRNVLIYPDKRLRQISSVVTDFSVMSELAKELTKTMYGHGGIGISAIQIGEAQRVMVAMGVFDNIEMIDGITKHVLTFTSDNEETVTPLILVNPTIDRLQEFSKVSEGCLSFPGILTDVKRADRVLVKAQDVQGNPLDFVAKGLAAQIIQHELEHLDGVLLVDNVGPLKQKMIEKKLAKRVKFSSHK